MCTAHEEAPRRRGAVLSEVTVRGLRIAIDGPQGELREFPDGTTTVRTVPYGYLCDIAREDGSPCKVLGDDGDSYDVYVCANPNPERVWIFHQLHKSNGRYNEQKAVVGATSAEEAESVIRAHVHPKMWGRMGSLTWESFHAQVHAAARSGEVLRVEADEDVLEHEALKSIISAENLVWVLELGAVTNFPGAGDNKAVALTNSKFARFDLAYADGCRAECPDVWRAGMEYEPRQYDVLARVARWGGVPKMMAEVLAVRCREAVAARDAERSDIAGCVHLMRWCAVGAVGEAEMKKRIDAARAAAKTIRAFAAEHAEAISAAYGKPVTEVKLSEVVRWAASDAAYAATLEAALKVAGAEPPVPDPFLSATPGDSPGPPGTELTPPAMGAPPPASVQAPISEPTPSSTGTPSGPCSEPSAPSTTPSTAGKTATTPRVTPQPAVAPDHRSEDAADPGPLSLRTPRTPMPEPQEQTRGNAFDALFAKLAALRTAAPALFAEAFGDEDAGAGVPRREPAAPVGQKGDGADPKPQGQDASRRVLSADVDKKSIDEEKREVWFIASTASTDSHREIVDQSNWKFERFAKNPVILWAHRSGEFPIGKAVEWKVENGRLLIKVRFSKKNPVAILAWDLIVEDMLRACSVGFMPGREEHESRGGRDVWVLYDNELYELSICSVPSNPDSVTLSALEDRVTKAVEAVLGDLEQRVRDAVTSPRSGTAEKGAIPYKAYPTHDAGSWDAAAAKKRLKAYCTEDDELDYAMLRRFFAYEDPEKAGTEGALKLPHHDIVGDKPVTVREGVVAACNALQGSRGGVDIPDSDLPKVKAHLKKHCAQFDIVPPWEKDGEKTQTSTASGGSPTRTPMILKTIDSAGLRDMRAKGGLYVLSVAGEEVQIDMRHLITQVDEATTKAEAEARRAGEAIEKAEKAEADKKAAQTRATDLLVQLTKLQLDPMIGLEAHQMTPVEADALAKLRSTDESTYGALFTERKARFDKGVAALQQKAEEAARAAAEAAKKAAAGEATATVPPTRAADPTPPVTATAETEMDSAVASFEARAAKRA